MVIGFSHTDKNGNAMWKCKCDCGNEKIVMGRSLRIQHTISCGCLHREQLTKAVSTHRMSKEKIFQIWSDMKQRCFNSKVKAYKNYGGRGITVCDDWLNDFQSFYDWAMANGYKKGLTIERVDVNGNYEPSNCKWITKTEQNFNKTNSVFLTYKGVTKTLAEWSRETGIAYHVIRWRYQAGKKPEEILKVKGI